MHRSGTSCLTGCLENTGLYLGEVVNKAPDNSRGNKENLSFRKLNNRVLAYSGGSWRQPPSQLRWDNTMQFDREALISNYSHKNHWGFKDPRNLLTLPFWLESLPDLGLIGTFRNPISVARSLEKRIKYDAGMSIEAGLELWKVYNLKLIELIDIYDFPLVCFDWPPEIYESSIIGVAHKIGLHELAKGDKLPFYDATLRRQHIEQAGDQITQDLSEIYDYLCLKAESSRVNL